MREKLDVVKSKQVAGSAMTKLNTEKAEVFSDETAT